MINIEDPIEGLNIVGEIENPIYTDYDSSIIE